MENYQSCFKRYEVKYMITKEQFNELIDSLKKHIALDDYGLTHIRNVYFDTQDYRLIRSSIQKPTYKEKLRIRSYHKCNEDTKCFIELKKKYKSVVYKRRISLKYSDMNRYLDGIYNGQSYKDIQIDKEIKYFFDYYKGLSPKCFLSYDRLAYYSVEDKDLRITFDTNVRYRDYDLDLKYDSYGKEILNEDIFLMEIKTSKGMPMWLCNYLSEKKIYKKSFSKYGNCYLDMLREGKIKL